MSESNAVRAEIKRNADALIRDAARWRAVRELTFGRSGARVDFLLPDALRWDDYADADAFADAVIAHAKGGA